VDWIAVFPKINVLHTIAGLSSSSGGPSRSVTTLCNELGARGVTTHLLTQHEDSNENGSILPDFRFVHFQLVPLASGKWRRQLPYSPHFRTALNALCSKEDIQIIHDHGLWLPSNHEVAREAKHLKIPLIISPRGMLEPWALSYRSWKKRAAWAIFQHRDLKSAALLIATSEQEAESIRKVGLRQPIAIISNGVALPVWKERPFPKDPMRFALFLSRIHPKKGLMNLVAAWARVSPKGWRMVIAGPDEGRHREEVERAVQRAGLEKDFLFVGPVEGAAKEKLYREADLFIFPTFSENFGIVVAEALSYGVPVIATRGAPWEELVKRRCGWWVDIGVEPLVKAIREAISVSDDEREDMGMRGRKYAEDCFGSESMAKECIAVYAWILGAGEMPGCIRLPIGQ
jgi:glycosyltransferase involved in cell wall biosynthesis